MALGTLLCLADAEVKVHALGTNTDVMLNGGKVDVNAELGRKKVKKNMELRFFCTYNIIQEKIKPI